MARQPPAGLTAVGRALPGRRYFQRVVLGRPWLTFVVMGLAFLCFSVLTLNLLHLLRANADFLFDNGWRGVLDGGARQLLELAATGYAAMLAYVVLKACEHTLSDWLCDTGVAKAAHDGAAQAVQAVQATQAAQAARVAHAVRAARTDRAAQATAAAPATQAAPVVSTTAAPADLVPGDAPRPDPPTSLH